MSATPGLTSAASAPPPTGTVTFAFTELEGSTQRWDRDRDAMRDAVRRHDALMRAAIHTGTGDERDGDYFGQPVNRVARLLSIAHGGQLLVSGVTSDLVRGALPPRASLRDLGEHRLKDLTRPENVYRLFGPGLGETFPPLRSLDALPHNLPLALTPFIGRETEIAEIAALLETSRLVTLVGSGGIGTTRTSLQVAANLLDRYGDGVWFVELAPLSHGDYVPTTIAQIVGVALATDSDALAQLVAALVRILGPKQLRDRFDERFRVPTGGHRDVLPRQQTLRALIDWSYDLLDERERTVFLRFGIFVKGFTLEGASIVASDESLDEFEIFDVLASLVEKSLILAEPSGGSLRGELARAATLAGYGDACLRGFAIEREMTERGTHDHLLPMLRANLAVDELARLSAAGAALAPEAAIALALENPL